MDSQATDTVHKAISLYNAPEHFEAYYRAWRADREGSGMSRFLENEEVERRFFRAILSEAVDRASAGTGRWRVRALEVGSGPGLDLVWLKKEYKVFGVGFDVSREVLNFAQQIQARLGVRVSQVLSDVRAAGLKSESFDLVYSQGVMEHFQDPWPALAEQVRLLRPGGILLICVPQRYNRYTLYKRRLMRAGRWPWGWECEYSARELRQLGLDLGLIPVAFRGFGYNGVLRIARNFYRLVRKKNPHRGRLLFRWIDRCYFAFVDPFLEGGWNALEWLVGPYVLLNVVGLFRKPLEKIK